MAKKWDDSLSPGDIFGVGDVKVEEMGEDGVVQSVMIDGRRYILDEDEDALDVAQMPDPAVMRKIREPPRRVSPLLFANMFCANSPGLLIFGWIFACFGMIFVCAFVGQIRMADVFGKWKPAGTATLVSSEDAKMKVNDTRMYRHSFTVTPENGETITCVCHSGSKLMDDGDQPREVQALYDTRFGAYRLEDTSLGVMGGWGLFSLFVLLFPIIGLGIVVSTFRTALRNWRLLKYGQVTKGVVMDISPTGTKINHQDVMNVTFEYITADGQRLQGSSSGLDVSRITDDDCEVLFYDPQHPKHIFLLDSLPEGSGPEDVTGAFHLRSTGTLIRTLLMTAVTLMFFAIFMAELAYFFGFWTFRMVQ